jgi:imidazolonepropionase-like amidohydrolase
MTIRQACCVLAALIIPNLLSAQVTALRVGHLVDPETGTAAANQVILIEDGKFTAVGGNVSIPAGAEVVDLSQYLQRRAGTQ